MVSQSSVKIIVFMMFLLVGLAAVKPAAAAEGPPAPAGLRCEYLTNPEGVDVKRPRFFWIPGHTERGQNQTAYQILVSTDPRCAKGDVWDSGKVASSEFTHIVYGGNGLTSSADYFWKVRFWDKDGKASPYGGVARFSTGLFSKEEWKGTWIGGANQLRKEFRLGGAAVRAKAYICGLGYYELRINGEKVGTYVLDPGWTTYDKRALYVAYDVTRMLRAGGNAVAVILGEGWFKSRALLLQIQIELADGQKINVVSDGSWKASVGPITVDSIYNGETYDARLEMPGWDEPGFDDKNWKKAETVPGPKGTLSAQMMPPIRVMDTLVPLKMTSPKPGVYVFDMGQNFSGWARLRVSGPGGTEVKLRFAELLYDTGLINQENLRSARAEDVYILKGEGEEVYEPRFTFHGFRYVQMTGFPGVPTAETLRGRVVYSSVKQTGSFAASKPVLNGLQRIITWGQKTNLHSIPTDCNQRDERMGWMGDAQGTAEEAMMNFDMAAFYTNFIRDIRDVQDEKGTITDTVPHIWGSRPADPAWGTAYPLLCWYMYQYYGDKRILDEHFDGLKKYVEFLRSRAENGLLKFSSYGDWVAIDKTPGALVSTFYYYYDAKILADVSKILGKAVEAKSYGQLAEEIKAAFHKEFFDPKTGNYGNGSQTANALALFLELAPANARGSAWGNLFDNLAYKNNSHLTTGIIGTKYIMEVLTRFDNSDLAYDVAAQTSYPSWGYMIENGATTLWELWQRREGPSMNSHNHPMFGSVGSWLYKALAGINPDPQAVGFEKVRIEPQPVRDLMYASGSVDTLRGRVFSSWKRTEKSFSLEVIVPIGSEADVVIPKFTFRNLVLKEGGKVVWAQKKYVPGVPGILDVQEPKDGSTLILKIGSGRYVFELTGN
ncbi:MAG: family 78 glycoside hydrolase catalytic domain [Candidatus Aminicenantes bacterium]|nr:family 78 glycoside hydrolase catalytic domain [Candidatus Aminicenantes bacterium]